MVVWQFATIAALIGALLTYVMVLTNRLGTTNVLLKRIEEGLVRPQPVTENAPVATRQVAAAAEPARARVLEAVRAVEVVPAPVEVAPTAAEFWSLPRLPISELRTSLTAYCHIFVGWSLHS